MSEKVLRILMRLFAKLALLDEVTEEEVDVVREFLESHLSAADVPAQMELFHQYVNDGEEIDVRAYCAEIARELSLRQQYIIALHLLELIHADQVVSEDEMVFWKHVESAFKLDSKEVAPLIAFVGAHSVDDLPKEALLCSETAVGVSTGNRYLQAPVHGTIAVLNLGGGAFFILKYFGQEYLQLNHQYISPDRNHVLGHGSVISLPHGRSLYFSDISKQYLALEAEERVVFRSSKLEYAFANGRKGLHGIDLVEESGHLVAIMGASGSGKSTLLNVLNGNLKPSKGAVTINGVDLHGKLDAFKGLIGYVPQDDLLIDELTVYQNLYFNAKLCYKDKSAEELDALVLKVLADLGLSETRDLRVGNPLDKTISGGQRKRLNIGLELLRAPAIIFFDEPTSGLSSRDSENIMDLLKELTHRGKLIFVVIHQPSSEIFKMFDSLLVLDTGGYPIYYGNPVEAVIYFKRASEQINHGQPTCPECGNINPEQIFTIIETRVLDEFGNPTTKRKISPQQWHAVFLGRKIADVAAESDFEAAASPSGLKTPGWMRQFGVFWKRDLLAKLGNKQYLGINILQAPLLATILAVFVRYSEGDGGYLFGKNDNVPAFFFMSIVVALFTGMTMSAEEIFRDRKILKRENFLNLSRSGYLTSKVSILFGFSALQMASFVLISALVLSIPGLYLEYWLLIFSLSCFAIMLGLNVSATFNSAVTIYILIPLLLIPQLILSGTVVKFDQLNPNFTSPKVVPVAADLMASRWAYEGMMVKFFEDNDYQNAFFDVEQQASEATYLKDYWLPKMEDVTAYCLRHQNESGDSATAAYASNFALLRNEVETQCRRAPSILPTCRDALKKDQFSPLIAECLQGWYGKLKETYASVANQLRVKHDAIDAQLAAKSGSPEGYIRFKQQHHNDAIDKLVRNADSGTRLQTQDEEIVRRFEPIYNPEIAGGLLGYRTHFYAAKKQLFGIKIDTFTFNILVIWLMTLALYVCLHFEVFRKMLQFLERRRKSA
ncbi:MAG: ATP-binding cassette domain-containing protein [Bacteroidetes bacterium]|nr:ATP-binding cassette domain-containing protein [Bacteroidota bacterium]